MQWDMAAALAGVTGALVTVSGLFFRFLTKRIETLEKMVDTFLPAIERNTTALEQSNKVNEQFLEELKERRRG